MKTKHILSTIALAVTAIACISCGNDKALTEHVILIGLDGMGSAYFDRSEMPNTASLMDAGSWTLSKRSTFRTKSAINWASMFMGAGTELHGYTEWYSRTPELPSRVTNEHGIFPTINSILREQRPDSEIGALYEWDTIQWLVDSLALDHFAESKDYLNHPQQLGDMAVDYILEKKPNLLTIVFDHPDHEGHLYGWDSPEYHEAVKFLDAEIGRILQAVRDAGIWDSTTIIVTADHGGIGSNHGGILPSEYETPFIIAGKGIRNAGEFDESMMQYDVASTIAALFSLTQPQVWIGRPVTSILE